MKSSMKIDFLGSQKGLVPIIKVNRQHSPDTRDALISEFFQQLDYTSCWLRIEFIQSPIGVEGDQIIIKAVTPQELRKQSEEMLRLAILWEEKNNASQIGG